MRVQAVVVGGGTLGTSCFYHLVERGVRDVVLVEQASLASGSSGRSAAVVETQHETRWQIALTAWSMHLFHRFERDHGLPFVHHGYMRLGHTAARLETFRQSVAIQREYGITDSAVIEPVDITRTVPALRVDDLAGALFSHSDGHIDPVRLCELFAELGKAGGGQVLQGARVTGVRVHAGRVAGVDYDGQTIECDTVVNASGAWARQIESMVGIAPPVDGYRRQIVIFEPPEPFQTPVPMIVDHVPGVEVGGLYFRDDTPSRLVAGLHSEGRERPENPDAYRQDPDLEYTVQVSELLAARYHGAERFRVIGGWAGLYPLTPDERPILGELAAVRGFYNAIGPGGIGVQTSPAIGAIVADLVTKGETAIVPDLASFRLDRFAALDGELR